MQQLVCKEFLHKLSETVPGKLVCMPSVCDISGAFVYAIVVNRVPHGSSAIMCHRQQTHFMYSFHGNFSALQCHDKDPEAHCHMSQSPSLLHAAASMAHVARICTQFLEAENIQEQNKEVALCTLDTSVLYRV